MKGTASRWIALGCTLALSALFAPTADASFVFKGKFGTVGNGNGQFQLPESIAIGSGGDLYVADSSRDDIQRFTKEGQFKSKFGSPGNGDGQFQLLFGVGTDSLGFVYAADTGNSRVQMFFPSGGFVRKWGATGAANGDFNLPSGVDTYAGDAGTKVVISDQINFRMQRFSTLGTFENAFATGGGQALDIAADDAGNAYLPDTTNDRVVKVSPGGVLTTWGTSGSGDGQFKGPQGSAVDSSGNVWIADSTKNDVQKFTPQGVFLGRFGSLGSGDGQFNGARDVAIGNDGTIYVVDAQGRVEMFTELSDPPAAGPQPGSSLQPDQTAPDLLLQARKAQKPRARKLALTATCKNESCGTRITGTLSVRRIRSARPARTLNLRSQDVPLAAGERTRVEVLLGRKTARTIRKALHHHKRVVARVKVTATDSAGNRTAKQKTIRLKR